MSMTHQALYRKANELAERFTNGNRGHVQREIAAYSSEHAAALVAVMCTKIDAEDLSAALVSRVGDIPPDDDEDIAEDDEDMGEL